MSSIPRFKAADFKQGQESVVGSCNGFSMQERWKVETPAFASGILRHLNKGQTILDYGCGVGRLAKEILNQNNLVTVLGIDASPDELKLAKEYVNDSRFIPMLPWELNQPVDLAYCVYVLQHIPAIELREAIQRIHKSLIPGGILVYCSSDYRMAINDGGGFTDDRHLGVNIRRELGRVFDEIGDLFDLEKEDPLIRAMVTAQGCPNGSIPHPAKIYRKRPVKNYLTLGPGSDEKAPETKEKGANPVLQTSISDQKRVILRNRLSPGDILVMSAAIRALKRAHPEYKIDVDTPCNDIFSHNPNISLLNNEGQVIDMHYHKTLSGDGQSLDPGSGVSGRHFADGHRRHLEEVLGISIPNSGLVPEIFLTQDERLWPSPALGKGGYDGAYWVINAGSKNDFPLKQYHRYQEVVDLMIDRVKFVQVGDKAHNHPALKGVIDLRGKTNHRELFRLVYHAHGVLSCVSYPMHIAAAFQKPTVVVAGGREGTRWELYPNHRFLYTNGALPCCAYDGCWKSKLDECAALKESYPLCMWLIEPRMIADAIDMYYQGGILTREEIHV